jgi:hypothetical protein
MTLYAAESELLVAVDEDNAFLLSFPDHGLGETASTEKSKVRSAFIAALVVISPILDHHRPIDEYDAALKAGRPGASSRQTSSYPSAMERQFLLAIDKIHIAPP